MESSKAKRKTAAEAIDILATAYRSSNYLEKTTEQIVEMKNMVSWAPVPTTGNENTALTAKSNEKCIIDQSKDILLLLSP